MSKKDYITLADALRQSKPLFGKDDGRLRQWTNDVETIRFVCASNPRFNSERWLAYIAGRCGPSGGKI